MSCVAVSKGTANAGGVAPDQLREMAPLALVVRVVVRIFGLLFMPAVNAGTSELNPILVLSWSRAHRGKIATTAVLWKLAVGTRVPFPMTHMLRVRGAFAHRLECRFGKFGVPRQLLSTMDVAPVPVRIHNDFDEVGIIDVGSIASNLVCISRVFLHRSGTVTYLVLLDLSSTDSDDAVSGRQGKERRGLHLDAMNERQPPTEG